jgi:hypothetical protein
MLTTFSRSEVAFGHSTITSERFSHCTPQSQDRQTIRVSRTVNYGCILAGNFILPIGICRSITTLFTLINNSI